MTKVNFVSNARIILYNGVEPHELDVTNLPDEILKTIDYCVSYIETVLKVYIHLSQETNTVVVNVTTWDGISAIRKHYVFDGDTGKQIGDWVITESI